MFKIKFCLINVLILISTVSFCQRKSVEKGIASYYHDGLTGNRTANGERYDPTEMTAAHLTLPFDSQVKVINLSNHKTIIVRINDRGPFIEKRIIDLSRAAADSLGFLYNGIAFVQINVLRFGKAIDTSQHQLLENNIKKTISKNINNKQTSDSIISVSIFKQPNVTLLPEKSFNINHFTQNNISNFDSINSLWVFNIPKTTFIAKDVQDNKTETNNKKSLNDTINYLWSFNIPKTTFIAKDVQYNKTEINNKKSLNDTINYLWAFNILKNNINNKEIIEKKNPTILPNSFVAFRLPDLNAKEKHIQNKDENLNLLMAFTKTSNKISAQKSINTKIIVNNIQKDTVQKNLSGLVYGVQIGSFKLKSNMLNLSEKLKKNYIDKINIQEVNKDNTHFYRLILGEFNTMAEAKVLMDRIMNEYPQSFIISFNIK